MAPPPRIGTTLRRARERKRWTQQQLADAADVSLRTVNDWENDRSYPRNRIGALEQILDVRLDTEPPQSLRTISPELRKLIAETLDDPDDQRRVIGLLEGTLTWPGGGQGEAPHRHQRAAG